MSDAVFDSSSVNFQGGFSRTPRPNPPGEPGEGIVLHAEPRQQIFQLRHFHLDFSFATLRPSGEDIEDQLGAIDHAQFRGVGERAHLRRIEVLIEDQQVNPALQCPQHDLPEFAFADQVLGVDLPLPLDDGIRRRDPAGARQFDQFRHRFPGGLPIGRGDADQNRPVLRACRRDSQAIPLQFILERLHQRWEVQVGLIAGGGWENAPARLIPVVRGENVRNLQLGGTSMRIDSNRCQAIQPQEYQVHEILLRKRFFLEMGVHQPQPSQTPASSPAFGQVWNEKGAGPTNQHRLHRAVTRQQEAHLAPALKG